ncbi:hypothetical protein HPB50_020974 [Hyalomma asiaticum]|uniref:Uncharacterized protein n=1 Tax=Hyalomma asiaticum TaxID=266040 RepID=A0ACB7T405_HYAAI|nr:hypothetical protein HPB50_020974 [Hyalomma asiaticum]
MSHRGVVGAHGHTTHRRTHTQARGDREKEARGRRCRHREKDVDGDRLPRRSSISSGEATAGCTKTGSHPKPATGRVVTPSSREGERTRVPAARRDGGAVSQSPT